MAPHNAIYDYGSTTSAPECLGCTAWWGDGRSAYLKALHPATHQSYQGHLAEIAGTLQSHLDELQEQLHTGA